MTTEDDFHAAIDAQPDAHHLRLVFADWLEDRCDPRAEGYRALGRRRITINRFESDDSESQQFDGMYFLHAAREIAWWPAVFDVGVGDAVEIDRDVITVWFRARRSAEDAAARAFPGLPAARRADLLATEALA